MFDYLITKLQEPSTWRGFISLATASGVMITPEQTTAIIAAGLGLMGLINVFRTEIKK